MLRRALFRNFRVVLALDNWIRQRFTKAGQLVLGGLIAAGVFGIDTRQTWAYQLFSLLLALILLAILTSWWGRIRLAAQRELPQFATVGETLHYRMGVQNKTPRWQCGLILRENIQRQPPSFEVFLRAKEPGHEQRNWFDNYVGYPRWLWLVNLNKGADGIESSLPPLPPIDSKLSRPSTSQNITITMSLTPLRRGYIQFTGISFARSDPLGLFNALYTLPLPGSLLVLPKRYPVAPIFLSGSRRYQRGGVQLAMSVGEAEEFVGLREYRPGDPLRHIHWKSWAKVGKPVVKEFQDEFFVRHALILDTFTTQVVGELFESAVAVAASFACAPRSQEILLDLMLVGTQAYCFTSGRGLSQPDQLLEILACVEACTEQPFTQLYSLVMEHTTSLSGSICVLLNWDTERQRLIQSLKNQGISLLVVIVSDTELEIDRQKFPEVQVLPMAQLAEKLINL